MMIKKSKMIEWLLKPKDFVECFMCVCMLSLF